MKRLLLLAALLATVPFSASAAPIYGAPDDELVGCDSPIGGLCTVTISESGYATANFHSFFNGGSPGDNNLNARIALTAPAAFTDANGNPLEVTSWILRYDNSSASSSTNLSPGAVGLCEFGASADGSSCLDAAGNPTAAGLSDVVVFEPLTDGSNRISLLSDANEQPFAFATNFNVPEVGPEGANGALYRALGDQGGGEDVFYNVQSDPEPATLALFGLGLGGMVFARRRRA